MADPKIVLHFKSPNNRGFGGATSEIEIRSRLAALRRDLRGNGAELEEPEPEAPPQTLPVLPRIDLLRIRRDLRGNGAELGEPEPEEVLPAPPQIFWPHLIPEAPEENEWTLVGRLGLTLCSDGTQGIETVRNALDGLGDRNRARVVEWLSNLAEDLAADPHLAAKSRGLRLHLVALGEQWFRALQETPTLVDWLETNLQDFDLEALLG